MNDEIFSLIKKISKNEKIDSFEKLKKMNYKLYSFFKLLKNVKIFDLLFNIKKDIKNILKIERSLKYGKKELELNLNDIEILYSYFIIKCFSCNVWFEKENDFDYVSIDELITNFINYENKFWIFYYNKELENVYELRKDLFKLYLFLNYKNVIYEKRRNIIDENSNIKTMVSFTTSFFFPEEAIYERITIEENEYIFKKIGLNYYLIGSYFLNVCEVFRENVYSGNRFILEKLDLAYKLTKRFVEINKEDFDDVKKIYLNEYNDFEIEKDISKKMNEMNELNEKIYELNIKRKKKYKDNITKKIFEIFENFNLEKSLNNIILFSYTEVIKSYLDDEFKTNCINNLIISNLLLMDPNILEKFTANFEHILNNIKNIVLEKKTESKENMTHIVECCKKNLNELIYQNLKKIIEIFKNYKNLEDLNKDYQLDMLEIENFIYNKKTKQKEFSNLFDLYKFKIVEKINLFNKKIYFPFYFDFRGRLYFDSIVSVTFFKPSRLYKNYGKYSYGEIEILKNTKFYNWKKFKNEILNIKVFKKIQFEEYYIKESIFWVVISIGKELLKKNKESHKIEEIFMTGYNYILNEYNITNIEKKALIFIYIKILESLKEELPIKRFLQKDATASFIQNTIRILGPKNENSLIKANLLSTDTWYDTYIIAISEWKKKLDINSNKILIKNKEIEYALLIKYFVRNTVKKPVMTSPYASTFPTKWKYFLDEIWELYKEKPDKNKNLLPLFVDFNKFIDNFFWNEVFLSSDSKELVDLIIKNIKKEKKAMIRTKDALSDIIYFNMKIKKIDLIISIPESGIKIRRVKNIEVIDNNKISIKKLKSSIRANWVHFSDASLVRDINSKYENPLLSIHDCFLVDPFNITSFIDTANKSFKNIDNLEITKNKKLFHKIYSLFIFI